MRPRYGTRSWWFCAVFLLGFGTSVPLGWAGKPTDDDGMEPPGDCTQEEHRRLKRAVGENCKGGGPMKCEGNWQSCEILLENFQRFAACIQARKEIAVRCYRGGGGEHKKRIKDEQDGARKCIDRMVVKGCPAIPCEVP